MAIYSSSIPEPFPPERILILGAGRFGRLAAARLKKRYPKAEFLLVDDREEKVRTAGKDLEVPVLRADVESFIGKNDLPDDVWVVPAVPVHVAFLWILSDLKRLGHARVLPVPETVDGQVPNPLRVANGTLYASFATFICPDACSEPEEICTYTKKQRQGNLFDRIEQVRLPGFGVVVVRSWQLAPGVGGYPVRYVVKRLAAVREKSGAYLIATSCRCHGVLNCLDWNRADAAG